jgi:von Willebrand factor type A domain
MHHGVSVRVARAAPLVLALAVAAAATASSDAPESEASFATVPQRCSEGPGPIEILAADVVIAIDRSTSTREPTGHDLDGDGTVGEFRQSRYTDHDDSMLAAELAAVDRLIEVARLGGMRFAIVSYSGRQDFPLEDSVTQRVDRRDARLEAELTDDPEALEAAVARVARRGADGASSFAPAMRLALRSLEAVESPASRRRVLFLSDSATPVRFAPMDRIARDDPRMENEARRAIKSGVSFHSFAIGEAAEADNFHALAHIAGATGGTYRPVPDPRALYCQMLAALGARDPR